MERKREGDRERDTEKERDEGEGDREGMNTYRCIQRIKAWMYGGVARKYRGINSWVDT